MKNIVKKFALVSAAAFMALASSTSMAALITENVQWSGASFSNHASAQGVVTFDTGTNVISGISLTVMGANAGNGTFSTADFRGLFFYSPSPLNYTEELIGQSLSGGGTFGTQSGRFGSTGDFNLFTNRNDVPTGTSPFVFTTLRGAGDRMLVTSMTQAVAAVPEPETYALVLAGLGALCFVARRRSGDSA